MSPTANYPKPAMVVTNDLLGRLGESMTTALVGAADLTPSLDTGDLSSFDLLAEVANAVLEDAGCAPDAIDGLVTSSIMEAPFMAASVLAEYLMLQPAFLQHVDLGGCTGVASVIRAANAIEAGLCETVLVLTAATKGVARAGAPLGPSTVAPGYKEATPQGIFDVPSGATGGIFAYGMLAAVTAEQCGLTEQDTYRLLEHARRAARRNPRALHFEDTVPTTADYAASPVTAEPLRRLDAAVSSGGASAVLVTSERAAWRFPHRPVLIAGMGERHTHRSITNMPDLGASGGVDAAARAFHMAGRSPASVDVAMIYDAFTYLIPRGLCEAGIALPENVMTAAVGDEHVVTNPHGGQLGCGHTGVAAGMSLVTAAVRQVAGRAGGVQSRKHDTAFVSGTGGEMSTNAALVLIGG